MNLMQFYSLIPLIFYVLLIGLHILLAFSVHRNAVAWEQNRGQLMFIGPRAWGVAALVCGVVGLLVYWLIHHSSLATNNIKE